MANRRHIPLEPEPIGPQMCSVELRLDILRRVPFFSGVAAENIAAINGRFHERSYAAGEAIYMAGDSAVRLYVVAVGKVKVTRHTLAGQDVVLDILAPGELFGALSTLGDAEYPDTAQALTPSCVLEIAAEDFQAILQGYPTVALAALDIVAGRLQIAHEQIRQLSAQPATSRVAAALLALGRKLGEPRDGAVLIEMPLSREDLAAMTGATVETVSRIMSKLRTQGVIRSGRRWVAIADHDRLAALAGEETS
jgi:CRP/FNR family transcriptional regulator, nitrogen oxide reductase regulator